MALLDVCWELWDQSGKIINKNKKAQGSNRAVTARLLPWQSLYVDICVYPCTYVRDSVIRVEIDIENGVDVEIDIDIAVEVEVAIELEIEVEIKVESEVEHDIKLDVEIEVEVDIQA